MKEFNVNKYISLKLERDTTSIYVNDKLFSKCKYLLLNVPSYKIQDEEYDFSIDRAAKSLGKQLEMAENPEKDLGLSPEDEFQGHCSNLQAWAESGYEPKLLHSNLAFPLLKRLADVGDPLAKKVFKQEIAKKFETGAASVVTYMIEEGYFDYFNMEEFEALLDELDFSIISINGLIDGIINYYKVKYGKKFISTIIKDFIHKLKRKRAHFYFPLLKKVAQEGEEEIKELFLDKIEERIEEGNVADIIFLIKNGYLEYFEPEDVEEFLEEIPYPKRQEAKFGHMDRVNCICFTPDGKYLISAGGPFDKSIKIWDTMSWEIVRTLIGHTSDVNSIVISSDGKYVISGSWDKTIKVWDFSSGVLISTLKGHTSWIRTVDISPNNKLIVSGSGDTRSEDFTVRIWDLSQGSLIKTLEQLYSDVNSVKFTSDGNYIVTGAEERKRKDYTIKIWDVYRGKLVRTVNNYTNSVLSLDLSPNGTMIASGSKDNKIKIWKFSTGELLKTFQGHDLHVLSVRFSSDGKFLISGSADGYVKIWEIETGQILYTLKGHNLDPFSQNCWINTVAFSPNNNLIACGAMDNSINVWNLEFDED